MAMRSPPPQASEGFAFSTCVSKVAHESRKEAQATNLNQKPYMCPLCGKWHLTTNQRKPR